VPRARGVIRAAEEAWGWLTRGQGAGVAAGARCLGMEGWTDGGEGEGLAPASPAAGMSFGTQEPPDRQAQGGLHC